MSQTSALHQADEISASSQLAAILEATDDGVISLDAQGIITSWSRSAAQIFGYEPQEIIGQSLAIISLCEIKELTRNETVAPFETICARKDGSHLDARISCATLHNGNETNSGAMILIRDITLSKQTERAARETETGTHQRAVVLETANRIALDILSSRVGAEALRHIADAARVLASARYAALGVADSDGNGLKDFITVGLTPEEEAAIGPLPRGHGVLGLLLNRTEPLRMDKISSHPASVGFPSNHPPMDSFLGVPIRRGQVVLGSLYLTNKQGGGSFTEADETAVQALGDHAAVAIHHADLLGRQRTLVSSLLSAQEEERRAMAYDLHDGLTQYIMASHAHLEAFKRASSAGREEKAARELEQGLKYLKEAVMESRRQVNGLRLLALDDLGLTGALDQLLREEKERAVWESAEFLHNIGNSRFDRMLETGIYRIAQEALTNARRHAATSKIQVRLMLEKGRSGRSQILLAVRDWGQGFVPSDCIGAPGHVGLQGIIERAHLLGATFELDSKPGHGTMLCTRFYPAAPQSEPEVESTEEAGEKI
jgi:PAS domain S-box-containing protein